MSDLQRILRIEAAALAAWPPAETARDEGWLLRASGGNSRRANSVQALVFASGASVDRAVDRVEAWYAKRGLPAWISVNRSAVSASPCFVDSSIAARASLPNAASESDIAAA